MRPVLIHNLRGDSFMLYLTAIMTVLALVYLTYAMIKPEKF